MIESTIPISREQLRTIAVHFREALGLTTLNIDVLRLIEKCQYFFKNLTFEILDDSLLLADEHARFVPDKFGLCHVIYIKNSVYENVANNTKSAGRDRMTIVHEIAHFILIVIVKIPVVDQYHHGFVPLAYSTEWQAMALAGEIMMPYQETAKYTDILELAGACGVSIDAANYRINRYAKEQET